MLNTTHNRSMSASLNTTTNVLERSHSHNSSANTSISFTQGSNTSSLPTPGKRKLVNISMGMGEEGFEDGVGSNNTTQLDISSDRDGSVMMDGNTTLDLSQPVVSNSTSSNNEGKGFPVSAAKRQKSLTRTSSQSSSSKGSEMEGEMPAKELKHSSTRTRSRRQSAR